MAFNLKNEVHSLNLFKPKDTVVLALSGGVDSMVLLDILLMIDVNIIIAHINHNVRENSQKELFALKEKAKQLNLPFKSYTIKQKITTNFQAESRKIRYNFFKQVADEYNTKNIVTAHHLDDQIETFLMRLSQNHDLSSLKSMQHTMNFDNYYLIRPFAKVYKQQILDYAKEQSINFFEDHTNQESYYLRNYYRNEVVPVLEKKHNNFKDAIIKKMDEIYAYDEMIYNQAKKLYLQHPKKIPVKKFLTLDSPLQKHLLKLHLQRFNCRTPLSKGLFDSILSVLNQKKNIVMPIDQKSIFLHVEYDVFFFYEHDKDATIYKEITAFGKYEIEGQYQFFISKEKKYHKTSKCIELWYNEKVFPIQIRTRAQGDYIEFDYGRKKLKKLLIDLKVPPLQREQLIVVAKGRKILWIPSLNISAKQTRSKEKLYIYYTDISAQFSD